MSKQSIAKELQGYTASPPCCGECTHFTRDRIEHPPTYSWSNAYVEERNLRCGLGGFAVKKRGTCKLWESLA